MNSKHTTGDFIFQERPQWLQKAETGVMCSLVRHSDPEENKEGCLFLSFSHARPDLVMDNISSYPAVRSHQHTDSNEKRILPTAKFLWYRCVKSLQGDSLMPHSCQTGETVEIRCGIESCFHFGFSIKAAHSPRKYVLPHLSWTLKSEWCDWFWCSEFLHHASIVLYSILYLVFAPSSRLICYAEGGKKLLDFGKNKIK